MLVANTDHQIIINEFLAFISNQSFPCIGAKAAVTKQQMRCMVAEHLACPKDDQDILHFLYQIVDEVRLSEENFLSASILFQAPEIQSDKMFDELFWQRLQALADLDAKSYGYDPRVQMDPASPFFSFSLKEEAFFIIGLHASSSRLSRQFKYPTLVFNPHVQFEKLRASNRYESMKEIVRKRDITYSGSINPMLDDFGKTSEVYQYSGMKYDENWTCPLKINHGSIKNNSGT